MANSRFKTALTKILDKSSSPVYLIDGWQRLAYGNKAFFEWIGTTSPEASLDDTAQQLIGARLVYSNSSNLAPLERKLCGAAPPPDLVAGGRAFTAPVANDRADKGQSEDHSPWHSTGTFSAHFSFIDVGSDQPSLLAVVGREPSEVPASGASELDQTIRLHTALRQLSASIQPWNRCSALIGESRYVRRLQKQVQAASQHALEFTIVGPSGSGRENLARMIMKQRHAPTAAPTAAEIQDGDLVTLHGYVADTELVQSCVAQATDLATQVALEKAHRTDKTQPWLLILDADQLDASAQAELWSNLQSPGSRLRILATAERDLIRCVATDGFHPGLAHMLTTQTIQTMALHQHLEDLPLLIQYEIEGCNADRQNQLSGFSDAAMLMMTQYSWPGDLVELASVIRAASSNCPANQISVDNLPEKFRFAIAALKSPPNEIVEINLESYLSKIELRLVARALQLAKGNKTKAAKLLGVSRAKLLRRIQHFDFEQPAKAKEGQQNADLSADDFRPLDEPLFEEADE